jgi:hypothetical protein
MDKALLVGMGILVIAFLVAQVGSLWRWKGAWRLAGLVPLAYAVFVVTRIVVDVRRDPTSHNLWPMEVLLAAVGGLIGLGIIASFRRWQAARRRPI